MTPAEHDLARQAGAALAATRWARELAPWAVRSAAEDARRQTSVRPVDRLPWREAFVEAFTAELARLSASLAPGQPIPAPAAPAGPEWGDAAHRAATLRACHAARSVLHLCPDRLRAREADTHLSILESWARDPQVPPFASALALVDLAAVDEKHLAPWERGMLHASAAAGRVVCGPWALALGYADTAHTEACAAYARGTDPSGRRYAELVAEHGRRLADPSPAESKVGA